MQNFIKIIGAKENNLKDVNLTIPRDKLVVFTGVSGSGKSTLAFDTIFAEGQRRYMESLSSYARMFLGQMQKPDVEKIEGLSPAISIDQKTTHNNPRSTVGTVTEIYDYFRLLYARVGIPHCPICGREIARQTVDEICDKIMLMGEGSRIYVCAPVVRGRKGEFKKELESYKKSGFVRVEVDGSMYDLEEEIKLDKNVKHTINIVVDRLIVKEGIEKRLSDSLESCIKLANGLVLIKNGEEETLFSTKYACPECGVSIEELEPRFFSFNNPYGACEECKGIGFRNEIDESKILGDVNRSLAEGALCISGWNLDSSKMTQMYFNALSKHYGFDMHTPIKDLPKDILNILLYGNNGEKIQMSYDTRTFKGSYTASFEGVIPNLERRYRETTSDYTKSEIEKYMVQKPCSTCGGTRLKKEALAVTVGGINIHQACELSVEKLYEFIENLQLDVTQSKIAEPILKEIKARLNFLKNVGLDYLALSRMSGTLSGGEAQRIRLATQIGSGLTGVLYILDEPSIGLHQRDNEKLLATLRYLCDIGNTLIVVEHDEDTIRSADYIVDIGPKAGSHGGEIVVSGSLEDVMNEPRSITGDFLSGRRTIEIPTQRNPVGEKWLEVVGATQNNLKNEKISFPAGLLTVVTGVSGSGKSSLVNEILYPALANKLNGAKVREGSYKEILGIENFDKVIAIDQSPIGRTPRSNPATYTGAFTPIRELFAQTPDAKERGFNAGRFSFNVSGGRCENCNGDGIIEIAMHFLPNVYVPCEVCKGARYNRETLAVKYKGKNIGDVLEMTVDEAVSFFENFPRIYSKIKCLQDVGLGYIKLGQPATTLSGGEAQRVKLATELSKRSTGKTVYILDEPTTGLSTYDVDKLINILYKLRESGNTIIVIEHNLDIIKVADYIIDLGPEGGDRGGRVVACGTPEEVAKVEGSHTGRFINKILQQEKNS
ncbi:MAG: excinuclease ABC subunit UvrA [Clostridiales bacterium]|nr:excinuclease ABC subunit UvrA [Clostridiales bacterium]